MKNIRLPAEAYHLGHCFSVTIRTARHQCIFASASAVETAIRCLREAARTCDARVYAYCFMPDHVHLLARTLPDVDFLRFVNLFKQLSSYALHTQESNRDPIWQPRFYDHALRSSEGMVPVARYIFANPVRAGLVEAAEDYRYSGSLEWPEILHSGLESPALHSSLILET